MAKQTNFMVIPIEDVPVYGTMDRPDAHTPSILIVDDEPMIADTLARIFNQSGYAAIPAYSGARALELAAVFPPDLLITDVSMPGMTGIELAITIQQECPDCKILLFSAHASTQGLLARARAEGHSFPSLTKPVHPSVLLSSVSLLLPMRAQA